jgi:hypothetical protein
LGTKWQTHPIKVQIHCLTNYYGYLTFLLNEIEPALFDFFGWQREKRKCLRDLKLATWLGELSAWPVFVTLGST